MLSRSAPGLACAAWLMADACLAQAAPPPRSVPAAAQAPASTASDRSAPATVGEVVITGHRPQVPDSFAKSVGKFTHDLGRPGPVGRISRWREPVCPTTAGLSPGFDAFVTRRIKEVAARVGAPAAGDCPKGSNVLVVFTTQPQRLMADVRDHHEALLGFHYFVQTEALAAFQPPMKSWYVTTSFVEGAFGAFDQAYAPSPPETGLGSRIPLPLKSGFAFVLVVVDSNLLEGQAIGPVADKIAMLVLSRPAPRDGCSALPSIMDLLEPGCPSAAQPQALTVYDETFLKALYGFHKDEVRAFEREYIRRQLTRLPVPPAADKHQTELERSQGF